MPGGSWTPRGPEFRKLSLPVPTEAEWRRAQHKHRRVFVVVRRRKDFPPPTAMTTPCVLWQGAVNRDGYGVRKVFDGHTESGSVRWRTVPMHRWVLEELYGRRLLPKEVVLHECDNRLCYRVSHLRIGTVQLNNADMRAKGRDVLPPLNPMPGAANPNAKLSPEKVEEVRRLLGEGWVMIRIAARMGISKSQVQRIAAGKAWRNDDE